MLCTACGGESQSESTSLFETTESTASKEDAKVSDEQAKSKEDVKTSDEQPQAKEEKAKDLTEEQAYTAVINYCKANDPNFSEEANSEGYTEYWNVSTNENGEIVVLYRSYTAAQIIYYVNPTSGETYVAEFVPGITDEEQKTGETFNARDYLDAGAP
jgi:hypothetical protein